MVVAAKKKPTGGGKKKAEPKLKELTPKEIRALRESLGWTIEKAAAEVGVTPRTWLSWELPKQDRKPSGAALILLHQLLKYGEIK